METKKPNTNPRERILETAAELFFRQGYRATGINEVIARSGVAKATFYNHFPTKDDLCLAYLEDRNRREYSSISDYVAEKGTPRARFLAVIESIEPWLEANDLRGCPFLNMVAEVPDPANRLRKMGRAHYDMVHDLIRRLAEDLVQSDPKAYGHLDAEEMAGNYMVILAGAIAMAEVYHDPRPVKQAIKLARNLIE